MIKENYVSFRATPDKNTTTYLSLDGGKTILPPSDCGQCSQLVEINNNLAKLNKTLDGIDTICFTIMMLLGILLGGKLYKEMSNDLDK